MKYKICIKVSKFTPNVCWPKVHSLKLTLAQISNFYSYLAGAEKYLGKHALTNFFITFHRVNQFSRMIACFEGVLRT
jgi:hypothetical protein